MVGGDAVICACLSINADDCARNRYDRPSRISDTHGDYDGDSDPCDCACHDEDEDCDDLGAL